MSVREINRNDIIWSMGPMDHTCTHQERMKPILTNLGGNMARFTQFPIMITRSTIIYEIISPGAAGSSIYV